jgi:hypothetical protein
LPRLALNYGPPDLSCPIAGSTGRHHCSRSYFNIGNSHLQHISSYM